MKKVFIISAVLLMIVLIFLGIYNFAFKKNTPVITTITQMEKIAEPTKEIITEKKVILVDDKTIVGPVVDKKTGEIKYYDARTGFVWSADKNGENAKQFTTISVPNIKSASWSIDQNKVLTITTRSGKDFFNEYDYQSQQSSLLKEGLDNAVWDNTGTKIFYKYFDAKSGQRTLNIANADGSNWQKLADIFARNLSIAPIPLSSNVSFWNYPNALEETVFQSVGVLGGDVKTILSGKFGADYLWSPTGDRALISSLSNKENRTITLGNVSIEGKYQDLNIPTFVSKCVWSKDGKTLYYALPGNIPENAIMPNDYQDNKFNTEDTFWKLDLVTGNKERVIEVNEIEGKYDSSDLFLSAKEDALFFINKIDKKLYKINLKN